MYANAAKTPMTCSSYSEKYTLVGHPVVPAVVTRRATLAARRTNAPTSSFKHLKTKCEHWLDPSRSVMSDAGSRLMSLPRTAAFPRHFVPLPQAFLKSSRATCGVPETRAAVAVNAFGSHGACVTALA